MTGYTACACRDCMEIAIGIPGEVFCHECIQAGCADDTDTECRRDPDAEDIS